MSARRTLALLALPLVLAAAGCGSKKDAAETSTASSPTRVNANEFVYAQRVVDLYLRGLNRDLNVLNSVNAPEIRIYLANRNKETVTELERAMHDLHVCMGKLDRVGAPPAGRPDLARIDAKLRAACSDYERISDIVLEAAPHLERTSEGEQKQGVAILRRATPPSRAAALAFAQALKLMEVRPEFLRAGIQPSG